MAIRRPRVRLRDAVKIVAVPFARCGPEPEGAVHMHPCANCAGHIAGWLERVKRASVQVTRLQAHNRGTICRCAQRGGEGVEPYAAAVIARQDVHCFSADAEQPHRAQDGLVPVFAHQQPHRQRAGRTFFSDIDSPLTEQTVPCRGKRGRMRHLGARDER